MKKMYFQKMTSVAFTSVELYWLFVSYKKIKKSISCTAVNACYTAAVISFGGVQVLRCTWYEYRLQVTGPRGEDSFYTLEIRIKNNNVNHGPSFAGTSSRWRQCNEWDERP